MLLRARQAIARQIEPLIDGRRRLLRGLPVGATVVEVGVWKGDFSAQLLDALRPAVLHLVDPWQFDPSLPKSWQGGGAATSQADMDAIAASVRTRFAEQIESGAVVVHAGFSVEVASTLPRASADVVYIDGNHTYQAVIADLRAWADVVASRGFLAGDDYGDGGWWQRGVKRAVDEFAQESGLRLRTFGHQFSFENP